MKNVTALFVFCLILFSLISVPLSAQTEGAFDASKSVSNESEDASNAPQWVLNHGDAFEKTTVGQGALVRETGLVKIFPSGTDTTFTISMDTKDAFSAEAFPFFALRYRIRSVQKNGGLFFTTDTLTDLSDKSYSQFSIQCDGEWHSMMVDMRQFAHKQWKGRVTSFRLDPTNPSDLNSEIEISRLGFFPTENAADAFLSAADDTPDYAQETILHGSGFCCFIPGGTLSEGWKREEFLLQTSQFSEDGRFYTVLRDGKPVPSYVNSKGFAWYEAGKAGKYTLEVLPAGEKAVEFPESLQNQFGCIISSPFSPEYFTRDRIRIGAWGHFNPHILDSKYIQTYSDCGFDFLIASGGESSSSTKSLLLNECDRLGIEVFLNDGAWRSPMMTAEYYDHPSFCGHYITDEPGSDDYEKLGEICKNYQNTIKKTAYINLLPMYANAAQLKFGAGADAIEYYDSDRNLYRKYCEQYCEKVPGNYICTDIYPFNWCAGMRNTYKDYVESINVIASAARDRQRDFWCCIQTFSWTPSKRTPNAAEFRWQCYSLLSFGCKGILCWVYSGYDSQFPSLVSIEGVKTPSWYDAQTTFREIRQLSDIFVQYRNLGAFTHGASDEVPYLKMTNEYRDFAAIQEIQCEDPLLIGCFEKKENLGAGTAFTLVNMSELEAAKSTIVKLRLVGKNVVMYKHGAPQTPEKDADGFYIFPLETGEGVFVTLEK